MACLPLLLLLVALATHRAALSARGELPGLEPASRQSRIACECELWEDSVQQTPREHHVSSRSTPAAGAHDDAGHPGPCDSGPYPARRTRKGSRLLHMLRTTDPKDIAILYMVASFGFFLVGGAMALLMRARLAVPGQQFLSNEQYNELFTMHGTIMLLLYATPILFGFANYVVPLQIGAPDVAFPRLNAFSFWLFLFGGLIVMSGFLTPGGAATSAGSPTHRSTMRSTALAQGRMCRSWGW